MATIRRLDRASASDLALIPDLVRVFVNARRAHLQFLIDLHEADEDHLFFRDVVLPRDEVWVAEVSGTLAGFIAFGDGWVNHLYVQPAHQRQGVGSGLLAVAKGARPALQLWVFEANTPAIDFYESQGFHVVERTDGAGNEARMPDVRMQWSRAAGV